MSSPYNNNMALQTVNYIDVVESSCKVILIQKHAVRRIFSVRLGKHLYHCRCIITYLS